VTEDELNAILKPVDGKVNSFKVGVSAIQGKKQKISLKLNSTASG